MMPQVQILSIRFNKVLTVEECNATDDAFSTAAGFKIINVVVKNCWKKITGARMRFSCTGV
jgi:hypothetical protein